MSAPTSFSDTPTAGAGAASAGYDQPVREATLVAKFKAARDRKRERTGKAEGRKSHAELNPELVA